MQLNVNSKYSSELDIKDTTDTDMSVSYLNNLLEKDTDGNLFRNGNKIYDKRDDFHFCHPQLPLFMQQYAINTFLLGLRLSAYSIYMYKSVLYIRTIYYAMQANDRQFVETRISRTSIKIIFTQVLCRYNDLVSKYDISLSQMLTDVFHTCKAIFTPN